jgi:hypothetical protein
MKRFLASAAIAVLLLTGCGAAMADGGDAVQVCTGTHCTQPPADGGD